LSAETGNVENRHQESPQKRPISDTRRFPRFGQTGWWWTQSSETGLQAGTGNFLKISGENRLSEVCQPLAIGNPAMIQVSYTAIQALSCYSADQVLEARQQAIRCSTSGFFEPQTRHNARRIAQGAWAAAPCLARLLGCPCGLPEYRWKTGASRRRLVITSR
jgi:hypothetical protein